MSDINNDGGSAFPGFSYTAGRGNQRAVTGPNGIEWETHEPGMSLRDYFAGQELLSDYDAPEVIMSKQLAEKLAGPEPVGGWKDGLAMVKWEARWRAALKYIRADAMLAARKEPNP